MIDIIGSVIFTVLFVDKYREDYKDHQKDLTSQENTCKLVSNGVHKEYQDCLKRLKGEK
jgi:uncharacterized protein